VAAELDFDARTLTPVYIFHCGQSEFTAGAAPLSMSQMGYTLLFPKVINGFSRPEHGVNRGNRGFNRGF
jgi:hypothetical protein